MPAFRAIPACLPAVLHVRLPPTCKTFALTEVMVAWALFCVAQALCVPPVLYVSQWLMTVFAMPFPPNFSARIIDIMLQVR